MGGVSGLEMRESCGVKGERDTVRAHVAEFTHLDGQPTRPVPLTEERSVQFPCGDFNLGVKEVQSCDS